MILGIEYMGWWYVVIGLVVWALVMVLCCDYAGDEGEPLGAGIFAGSLIGCVFFFAWPILVPLLVVLNILSAVHGRDRSGRGK